MLMFLDYIPPIAMTSARKDAFMIILDVSVNIGNDLGSHWMPGDTTEMRHFFHFQSRATKHVGVICFE